MARTVGALGTSKASSGHPLSYASLRPASVKVMVRPLKKLEDAALALEVASEPLPEERGVHKAPLSFTSPYKVCD